MLHTSVQVVLYVCMCIRTTWPHIPSNAPKWDETAKGWLILPSTLHYEIRSQVTRWMMRRQSIQSTRPMIARRQSQCLEYVCRSRKTRQEQDLPFVCSGTPPFSPEAMRTRTRTRTSKSATASLNELLHIITRHGVSTYIHVLLKWCKTCDGIFFGKKKKKKR